jgi:hypothetical protein
MLVEEGEVRRELLIAALIIGRNGEPLYLTAGYLLKLGLPAHTRLSDQQ